MAPRRTLEITAGEIPASAHKNAADISAGPVTDGLQYRTRARRPENESAGKDLKRFNNGPQGHEKGGSSSFVKTIGLMKWATAKRLFH